MPPKFTPGITSATTSANQWQRSATHPNEAVFVHYGTDPDQPNASCENCFFRNEAKHSGDCIHNNCDDGYYIPLIRAAQLKVEST